MNNIIVSNNDQPDDKKDLKNGTLSGKNTSTAGGIFFKKGRYFVESQKDSEDNRLTQK